jgi:hypothetical protein
VSSHGRESRSRQEYYLNSFVDNQIRPTSSGAAVDNAPPIPSPWVDRCKLIGAPRRPAVLPQERSQIPPCSAFAPSIPQGPAPAASGLEICSRGRIYDHPHGMGAVLLAKPKKLGNAPSRSFCLILSSQSNIELKHDSEIVVEREPASRCKAIPFQFSQVLNCLSKLPV